MDKIYNMVGSLLEALECDNYIGLNFKKIKLHGSKICDNSACLDCPLRIDSDKVYSKCLVVIFQHIEHGYVNVQSIDFLYELISLSLAKLGRIIQDDSARSTWIE